MHNNPGRPKGINKSFDDIELQRMRADLDRFKPENIIWTGVKDFDDRFQTIAEEIRSVVDSCTDDRDLTPNFWIKYFFAFRGHGKVDNRIRTSMETSRNITNRR
jgi:hypothetical protein